MYSEYHYCIGACTAIALVTNGLLGVALLPCDGSLLGFILEVAVSIEWSRSEFNGLPTLSRAMLLGFIS